MRATLNIAPNEGETMKKVFVCLVLAACLLIPLAARAQGTVSEMTTSADLQRNLTPEQRAADALAKAERSMRTAKKKMAQLEQATDEKQKAKLHKKVTSAMERVERDSTSSLNQDPRQTRALFLRGNACLWLEKYEQAMKDCNQAFGLDKANPEALLCYGKAALKTGDAEQGMAAYKQLAEMAGGEAMRQELATDLRHWSETADPSHPSLERMRAFLAQEMGG